MADYQTPSATHTDHDFPSVQHPDVSNALLCVTSVNSLDINSLGQIPPASVMFFVVLPFSQKTQGHRERFLPDRGQEFTMLHTQLHDNSSAIASRLVNTFGRFRNATCDTTITFSTRGTGVQFDQYRIPQPPATSAAWWQRSGNSPCTLRAAAAVSRTMSSRADGPFVSQRGLYILRNSSCPRGV